MKTMIRQAKSTDNSDIACHQDIVKILCRQRNGDKMFLGPLNRRK